MNKIATVLKNLVNPEAGSEKNKIGLGQLTWLGFNYTCSLGFAFTLSTTFSGKTGVGLHLIWIIVLGSIIAGSAAWAYSKLSNIYSDKNGGGFEYTLSTFGPFHGWMVGFYQYILIPVKASASILLLVAVSFEGLYDVNMWGENTNLYLNLISIFIYLFLVVLILFGTAVFKLATNVTSIINWVVLLLIYVCAVIIIFQDHGVGYTEATEAGSLTLNTFNTSFVPLFFAFTGFETFAVVGNTVKNPKKTMPKAIMFVIIAAIAFYVIGFILIVGAIGNEAPKNPNNEIVGKVLGTGGLVVISIALLAQNINGFTQGAFYSGGMLQPLSEAQMITNKLAKLNKKNIAIRALITNIVITLLFAFFWLILPVILGQDDLPYASLVGFNSIVMFMIYGYVVSVAIYLYFKKILKTNIFVVGLWMVTIGFLLWQGINYFVQWDVNQYQVIIFLSVSAAAVLWYFIYIRRKYKTIPRPALPKTYMEREAEEAKLALEAAKTNDVKPVKNAKPKKDSQLNA